MLCCSSHGAIDFWLILGIVTMLVLNDVAAGDVLIILPQLGYVQSVRVLHTKPCMTIAAHTHTYTCLPSYIHTCTDISAHGSLIIASLCHPTLTPKPLLEMLDPPPSPVLPTPTQSPD